MYMPPPGRALDPSKHLILIIFDPLWAYRTLGDILTNIVSNSHFGKRPVARAVTIFVTHVLPQVTEDVNFD